MGKKLLVSLAMEGKFASHGLQGLDEDDDILTAMARELVTQKGVGEKADELWRQIQKQHSDMGDRCRAAAIDHLTPMPEVIAVPEAESQGLLEPGSTPNALVDLVLTRPRATRRPRYDDDAQLSLAF